MRRGSIFSVVLLLVTLGQGSTLACLLSCSPAVVTTAECHSAAERDDSTTLTPGDCGVAPNPGVVSENVRRLSDDTPGSTILDASRGTLLTCDGTRGAVDPDRALASASRPLAIALRI